MQKSNSYRNTTILYIILAPFLFYGCTNTKISRLYHDFNAKFNYLINARELYNRTINEFEKSRPDNYNNPAPIKIPTEAEALTLSENLDKVIEKASFIVKKHSNTKFIEETYMLLGKSNFYKLNINNASEIFQYVYNNFDNKKIKQEAMAYNALAKMLLGFNEEAEESIDVALNIPKEPKEINNIIYKAAAQILASSHHFSSAAKQMDLAAIYSNKKDKKEYLRNRLIEAFYYKKANNNIASEKIYKDIIDNNVKPKEVINNAKLNYLMSLIASNASINNIENQTLNEINNKENKNDLLFQSQLYYLLGNLYLKNNNYTDAIKYFIESDKKAGINNLYQQTLANKAIGDIYYEHIKDFKQAIKYYDIALANSITNIPDYKVLQLRKANLSKIENELEIIHKEDSLQKFAKLSVTEQEEIANQLSSKITQENKSLNDENQLKNITQQTNSNYYKSGSWYFYNNAALATAQSDFKKKWGNRSLTDRWRYSLKSSGNSNVTENILTSKISDEIIYDKDKLKDLILSQIPNNPQKLKESVNKEIQAYFNLIDVLYNNLNENTQTIKYTNELLDKYPDLQDLDKLYYILTEAYKNLNNSEKSKLYKNYLINKFPYSKYTQIIVERDTKPETIKANETLQASYSEAFALFADKQFEKLINTYYYNQNNNASLETQAKYAFLCAIALGKLQPAYKLKEELTNITNQYPETPYSKEAEKLISYINKNYENVNSREYAILWNPNDNPNNVFDRLYYKEQLRLKQELDKITNILKDSYFKKITNKDPLYVSIVVAKNLTVDGIRLNLRLFSRANFNKQWEIKGKNLSDNNQIIYIGPFNNLKEVNNYYQKLVKNEKLIIELDNRQYVTFVITENNLLLINSRKEVNDYLTYYRLTNRLEKTDF